MGALVYECYEGKSANADKVEFTLLLFWSFQKDQNYNKANWAKATLIVYIIRLCFILIIVSTFLSFFINLFRL